MSENVLSRFLSSRSHKKHRVIRSFPVPPRSLNEEKTTFTCPECNSEIEYVIINRYMSETAYLDKNGQIKDYGDSDYGDIDGTICPECSEDIRQYINR